MEFLSDPHIIMDTTESLCLEAFHKVILLLHSKEETKFYRKVTAEKRLNP